MIVILLILIGLVLKGWVLQGGVVAGVILVGLRFIWPTIFRRLVISFVKRTLMMLRTLQTYLRTDPKSVASYPTDVIEVS